MTIDDHPTPSQANANQQVETFPKAPRRRSKPRRSGKAAWEIVQHWFQANTCAPPWLPRRWCHPLVSYFPAILLEIMAASLTLLLVGYVPILALQGSLILMGS